VISRNSAAECRIVRMQRAPYAGKIFAIGFYKTGTTTLFEALKLLGYRTINGDKPGSYPGADDGETLLRQIERGDYRLPTFELFDAFTDNPYFHLWREIYALYPDAKYILTVRDEGRWIDSCVAFYRNRRIRPMRVWMFGKHANPAESAESRQAWRTMPLFVNTFAAGPTSCWNSTPRRCASGVRWPSSSANLCRASRGRTRT
jgi:Sulfotransferase domain